MKKANLDEMQEQNMSRVESIGFWIAFWGLFAAILVQVFINAPVWQYLGEAIILFALAVYYSVSCLRFGLWGRKSMPGFKSDLLTSFATAATVAIAVLVITSKTADYAYIVKKVCVSSISAFLVCFCVLSILSRIYKKRRESLDEAVNE